jgi:alanyl-tRNA synthetase
MYTVAIADGLLPGTRNANHKVRRIIRSAHWEVVNSFSVHRPVVLLTSLCDIVCESLGVAYPEIGDNLDRIKEVVHEEVSEFHENLRRTRKVFKDRVKEIRSKGIETMSGEDAFSLYKQLGCPVQLLQQLGQRHSIGIDLDRFDQILKEEHDRSIEFSVKNKESVNSS